MFRYIIPGIPPNLNQHRRMTHWQLRKVKQEWEEVVQWVVKTCPCPAFPLDKSVITYRFYFKDRRERDITNLYGCVKFLEDGLVKAGVIVDDSMNHTYPLVIPGGIDRKRPRVEIVVKEMENLDMANLLKLET